MRRTRLLCAIGVSLWTVVMVGGQTRPTGVMPEALRAHVKSDRFDIVTSVRGLPIGVRDGLQTLFGSGSLDIAEPKAEFQGRGTPANRTLPLRRLVAAGCARDNHCLVYYERGGSSPSWRVALFHWTPDATRFEWGATAPGGLTTVDDVQKAILSGTITGETTNW